MAENDDIDLEFQSNASIKQPRLSRMKRKLARKQKSAAILRELPIQLFPMQRGGTKRPRTDDSSEDLGGPSVKISTLSQASPTRSNSTKRPRVEEALEKLGEHSIGPLFLSPATTPTPKTKLPLSASKSIPLAYFVDVCLPEPPAPKSTIDVESRPRTYYGYVPLEVLSEIFVLCLPSQILHRTKREEAPLVLCHVCRHWRRVALETSILWDTFSAVTKEGRPHFHQKLLHLYLDRSRNRPLTLAISGPAENRFMEVLLSRLGRWKDVTVVIGASEKFAKLFFNLSFTPLLEALTIDVTTCNDPEILQEIPHTIARMAQLRRLTWKGRKLPPTFLHAPLHQLTHLDLWCPFTMHDCISILRHCPRLVTLRLDLKTESNSVLPSEMFINIPTLTHIDVIVYCELADFLRHFRLPSLSYIRVMHRRPYTHSFIGLEDFCTQSGCTLDTFWINDRRQTSCVVQRYLSLPCLQSIRELHIFAGGVGDDFLKALMVPNVSSSAPLLLPHLKRLIVGLCVTSDGLFATMIASRCTSEEGRLAGTGFEMVRALFRKGKCRIANRHPEDILGFRAMPKDVKVSWGWK